MLEPISGTNLVMATWDPVSNAPLQTKVPLVNEIAQLTGPDFLTAAAALRASLGWGQLALLEVFPGIGTLELYSLAPAVNVLAWSLGSGSTVILYLHLSATILKHACDGIVAMGIPGGLDDSLFSLPASTQGFLKQLKNASHGARILIGDLRRRQAYEKSILARFNRAPAAPSSGNSAIYGLQGSVLGIGTTTNGAFKVSSGLLR